MSRVELIPPFVEKRKSDRAEFRSFFAASEVEKSRARKVAQTHRDVFERVLNANQIVVKTWMTREYLGEELHGRYSKLQPVAMFDPLLLLSGIHLGRTNIVLVNPFHQLVTGDNQGKSFDEPLSESELLVTLAHEHHHYAGYLGGGNTVRLYKKGIFVQFTHENHWFREGLTEYLAQKLARTHGHMHVRAEYPYETGVAFLLEEILKTKGQEELLIPAYFSGDYTEVEKVFNDVLGDDSFGRVVTVSTQIVHKKRLCAMIRKMHDKGIDTAKLIENDELGSQLFKNFDDDLCTDFDSLPLEFR